MKGQACSLQVVSTMATTNPIESCSFKNKISIILTTLLLASQILAVLSDSAGDQIDGIDIESLNLQPDDKTSADSVSADQAKAAKYISPKLNPTSYLLFEAFDDDSAFKRTWIPSKDSKYEGKWQLNSGPDRPHADKQLLLPLKARHYAISSKLKEPFKFSQDKALVVQYEVQFRDGLDCGGAYAKLVRHSAANDLSKLNDKTPFTIMFGPDKCGSESKLHFIVQYLNPKTQKYEEKHWKQAKYVSNLMSAFTDKRHHLFKLILQPTNNFELFLDDKSVGKGNLLDDLDPPINPPKEVVDPDDTKPADWDERPQIDDPSANKPDDWDEDAPKTIEDSSAKKPHDWLENEPKYIPDPSAKKPDDWEDMDGEWEAPLIENPACAEASGCGEWKAPMVSNPEYKGKWKPPKIDNPNYKGKWEPRMMPNPDYFFDENPFSSLEPIGALTYELWSMADNIAFDNLIVTSDLEAANLLQHLTWQDKKAQADASSPSIITRGLHYLKVYPWLWVVVALSVALPLFLFISYCCDTKKRSSDSDKVARRKKTDESRPDDKVEPEQSASPAEDEAAEEAEEVSDGDDDDEDGGVDKDGEEQDEREEKAGDKVPAKRAMRQRKKN